VTRKRLGIALLVTVSMALLVVWVGNHTYWGDVTVPMPPKGEALVNPFYAAQRFAETLGARTTWDRMAALPDADAVIVVSSWHWSLSGRRRAALEQWVESGGRLVVDAGLIDPNDEFEKWTGIVRRYPDPNALKNWKPGEEPRCRKVQEEVDGRPSSTTDDRALWLCDLGISWLESARTPRWALSEKKGAQAMRVAMGRGTVTVINASPFIHRALFDGDHGEVFVVATELRRRDEVHFLSEDEYPSLLVLAWRYGAPVVAIALTLLAALLWRGAVRFGPLARKTVAARRSLADQIRGTGRFELLYGAGRSLHAACVRALDEAARRRIKSYAALAPEERLAALARLTGFDRDSLAAAIHHPGRRATAELRRTLALLEAARRTTLVPSAKVEHGTR
jgi:hypothetical protein